MDVDNKIFHLWNTNSRPPFRNGAAVLEIVTLRDNPFPKPPYFHALFSDEHISYVKGVSGRNFLYCFPSFTSGVARWCLKLPHGELIRMGAFKLMALT